MYKDASIPSGYDRIAEISDNYVVWVQESKLNSGTNYSAYYQFFSPSTWVLSTDNYRLKNGDDYTFEANYTNNGVYSYIDSYDLDFSLSTIHVDTDYTNDSDYQRADFLGIFVGQVLMCAIFVWVVSNLSRLFFKGGLR